MTRKLCLLVPLVAAVAFGCRSNAPHTADVKANATCPISGKAVDPSSFVEIEGHKIYTCCPMCQSKVKADPQGSLAKAYPHH